MEKNQESDMIFYYMHISTDLFTTGYPNVAFQNHITHSVM